MKHCELLLVSVWVYPYVSRTNASSVVEYAVDELGIPGLSCCKSQGGDLCHAGINNLINKTLVSTGIPAHLESTGLCRSVGECPDGATIVP